MNTPQPKRLTAVPSKSAVLRGFIWIGVILLFLLVFAWLALPAIVKHQAEQRVTEKFHRQLTIGKIEFNPLKLVMTVRDLKLMEPQGNAVFASFDALTLDLSSESLIRFAPVVKEVRLVKPYVHLVRIEANRYSIDDIIEQITSQPPSEKPARYSLNNIQLEDGSIEFEDKPAKTTHRVTELRLGVPFISSLPIHVHVFVEPLLSAKVNDTPLLVKGKARPFADHKEAIVELKLDDLDITHYLGYLPYQPNFRVPSARLHANLTASFQQPKDQSPTVVVSGDAAMKSVQITERGGKPVITVPELEVKLDDMDVFGGRFDIARVAIKGLTADMSRDRTGQLNLLRLLPPERPVASAVKGAATAAAAQVALQELDIRDASLRYAEDTADRSLRAGVEKFNLAARKLTLDAGKKKITVGEVTSDSANFQLRNNKLQTQAAAAAPSPASNTASNPKSAAKGAAGNKAASPYAVNVARIDVKNWSARLEDHDHEEPALAVIAPLSLSVQDFSTAPAARSRVDLKATLNKSGQLALNGDVGLAPLHTDLAVEMKNVDLLPLQPYVTEKVNLRLTQGNASGKGRLQLDAAADGALKGGFKGDASLANVASVDKASKNDFLRWKSLAFSAMDIKLEPLSLTVDRIALSDFFARIIIDATGRINVQDIARSSAGGKRSLTEVADRPAAAPSPADPAAPARPAIVAKATTAAQTAVQQAAQKLPPIRINKIALQGGRVRFTDNFIRPNYTANMRDLGGTVTGLSSDTATTANVDLRGEVNRAPLAIAGRINPLKRDLFLDVKATVRGMELATLSTYADKYVGYGIEKGKLSFEVAYMIDNRELKANNRLILEQLTFGKESTNPQATRLPVRLAVALLTDRNGVIDVNMPIDGSIDDPQFSIGGIILKVIGNIIVKAVTAPFTLLGSMFGGSGGEEMATLEFEPGRATIPAAGEDKLKSIAKALNERPALKLDITGHADAAVDIDGLKQTSIERKVRSLKIKDMQARGETVQPGSVVVKPEEYAALLTRVYKDESFTKPRNVIGMQKSVPVEEMEKLMIANTAINENDLIALGDRRAQAVKDWLLKAGHVAPERVFVSATKSAAVEAREHDKSKDKGASPLHGVNFALK
ncbi:DUF748 domain-containing protein [Noviherbaspirillum cavernae]|uniref:DUF748 domain-containing protein n=1 Tax=Noviherbaspirillum cavernae TaxID=2320862 RepID=A0A418WWK6_9BURK|nr:DUF748 domain-containing protein [Noviherbaspirillum cavernae]RJF97033.1 DUF748 domain-containing protein [Noviherbaspirillum cavernae]